MNQELQRIKNKDYGQLDDRLFNNLQRTGDLDNTISQLVELQAYLKNQIHNIQNQEEKQAVMQASKIVLNMGISDMGINGFSNQCQCRHKFENINERIVRLKKSMLNFKDYIQKQHLLCFEDNQQIFRDSFQHILTKYNKKSNDNLKLKRQIEILEQEISQLKQKNSHLKRNIQNIQLQKYSEPPNSFRQNTHSPVNKLKTEFQNSAKSLKPMHAHTKSQAQFQVLHTQNHFYSTKQLEANIDLHQTPRLPMPLRKQSSAMINYRQTQLIQVTNRASEYNMNSKNSSKYSESAENSRKTYSVGKIQKFQPTVSRSNVNVCQFMNDEVGKNKQKVSNFFRNEVTANSIGYKQNLMLKKKGAQIREQRKSTKKIKIFSHF